MGSVVMAPAMKAAKKTAAASKPMTKGGLFKVLAEQNGLKTKEIKTVVEGLVEIATKEVKRVNKFTIPQLCMIKTRVKPATKAGKRMAFGKEVMVKAKPAKTVVKAFCVGALKKSI